jgi:peptide chain release factor subunit 1
VSKKRTSLQRFRLKRDLEKLGSKEGRGTELVSLYVPPGRQISEAVAMLNNEYGTASNIKSTTTRKNVQDAIVKVTQRLKLFKQVPKNGLVIFCGAIPQNGPGSEKIETYVIVPPESIQVYLYRCDSRFHIEYLQEFLVEKETYGIIVLDASSAIYATLRGKRLDIIKQITSGVPGKFKAGGQSARRFDRQREVKLQEYFNRVGEHATEIFLEMKNLKGIILGGPGPTKDDFQKGNYLHYTLKDKILDVIDTSYVSDYGVEEAIERGQESLRKIRYVEEKRIMQKFLQEIGQDTGLVTYGEDEVRNYLKGGIVDTLILSEDLDKVRVTIECSNCNYKSKEAMKSNKVAELEQNISGNACPKCGVPTLSMTNSTDLIDDLAELAEETGADVEILSGETEEGQMLKKSFGGIAAILRYKAAI